MEYINRFSEGVKKNKAYFLYKNTEWTFPTMNIRLMNNSDRGFSITPLESNEVIFSVNNGYAIIGAEQYNGVLYIVSTEVNGTNTEIGVYPSPITWSFTEQSYERVYKALYNFEVSSNIVNLNTPLFKYSTNNEVEIIIKEIYDGSVNLYLCDYNVQNLVINSGFNQTKGTLTGKTINEDSFNGKNNLIPSTINSVNISFKGLSVGGSLSPGMYYLYYRYVDSLFSRTKFISETYPIQVNPLGDDRDIIGYPETDINAEKKYINARINLKVDTSTLDNSYEYLEIAVIRHSATEVGSPITEAYLIDRLYLIKDLITNNDIVIDGSNNKITISKEEIVNYSFPATAAKSHCNVRSRYFGANWKAPKYDYDSLLQYANNITVRYALGTEIDDYELYSPSATNYSQKQHKINELSSETITYSKGQYTRGEIVPFSVKFILRSGYITEGFPVNGGDDLIIGSYTKESDMGGEIKGLYRFPEISEANESSAQGISNILVPLGVKFDNTDAISYYNSNIELFEDVIGIVYLRGEKIENLVYQGFLNPTTYALRFNQLAGAVEKVTKTNIPFFASEYTTVSNNRAVANTETIPTIEAFWSNEILKYTAVYRRSAKGIADLRKVAISSPDYLFAVSASIPDGSNVYIKPLYGFDNLPNAEIIIDSSTCIYTKPKVVDINLQNTIGLSMLFDSNVHGINFPAVLYHIETGSKDTQGGYSAFVRDGNDQAQLIFESDPDDINQKMWNQSKDVARYLGATLSNDLSLSTIGIFNSIVNVYLFKNNSDFYNSRRSSFSVGTSQYYEISKKIDINFNTASDIIYHGDSFNNRTMFRFSHPFGTDHYDSLSLTGACTYDYNNDPGVVTVKNLYGHGVLLSILTENYTNVAMRNEVSAFDPDNISNIFTYTFYPRLLRNGLSLFNWISDGLTKLYLAEALQLNQGYNKTLDGRTSVGFDINRVNDNKKYITRIYFSPKSSNGELSDAFRDISAIAYQDYNLAFGQIVKVIEFKDTLISIQESRINKHILGQKTLSQNNASSDITLSDSGIYLDKEILPLGQFGSQHQQSVVKGELGVYGVDFRKRIIWAIVSGQSQTGASIMNAQDLSTKLEVKGWIDEVFDYYSKRSDIHSSFGENPVNGVGITSGYDAKNKLVFFTFHLTKDSFSLKEEEGNSYRGCYGGTSQVPNPPYVIYETIFISDNNTWYYALNSDVQDCVGQQDFENNIKIIRYNMFVKFVVGMKITAGKIYYDTVTGRAFVATQNILAGYINSIIELAYYAGRDYIVNEVRITINNAIRRTIIFSELIGAFIGEASFYPSKYFSINNDFMVTRPTVDNYYNKTYLFGANETYDFLYYFGESHIMQLSIIVNGGEKAVGIMKEFSSYILTTNNIEFSKIEFETDYMSSKIDPFIPNKWSNEYIKPEYKEGRWHGSMPINEDNINSFAKDEFMKGNYLKIILTFDKNDFVYINEIITNFIQSKI